MPIKPIALQRRHAELGRIRLGDKGDGGQPQKLQQFRFTSPHERHIRDLAQLYGGQARPWRNGTRDEWEVYSDARSIPVIVVRGGVSQWLETWSSSSGCVRRCDGERETLSDSPCLCDAEPGDRRCKPTTRLSVMLSELDAIGVWRLESHGWNAAAELPGLVELAQHVADLVPARLMLSERVSIRDGRTSRFVVPGLDLEVAPRRLAAIVSGQQPAAIEQPSTPAIESAPARRDYAAEATEALTLDDVRAIWREAVHAGHMNPALEMALKERVADLQQADATPPEAIRPPEDEREALRQFQGTDDPDEPSWVSDGSPADDADAIWVQVVAAAGLLGWTSDQLINVFAREYQGLMPGDASAQQLQGFLDALRAGQVAAA